MKKKKLLSWLLVLIMAFTAIGCGKENQENEPANVEEEVENEAEEATENAESEGITLTLAMAGAVGTTNTHLENCLKRFTEETGINVELVYIAGNWGEYTAKVQTMVGGGVDLDVVNVSIEGVAKFLDMGIAEPIDDYIEANPELVEEIQSDISPAILDVFVRDGNTYALPQSTNNVVMHFNTARLEEAGLELPDADWSTEEFLEYCEALTTEKDGVKQYAIAVPPAGEYFCAESWLINNGTAFMNEDCTESLINSPESVEIFQLWQDLIYKYGYAPIPEENVNPIQQLINGQVAMGSWGRWPTANYVESNFEDVAVQYLPSFSVNQQIIGTDGFFTLSSSKHIEEAKQLAVWLCQPEFVGEYLATGNIPALHTVAEEKISELGIPQNHEVFYQDSDTYEYKPVSSPSQYTECANIVSVAMSEILVNQADVQTTLDDAAAQMNEVLAANK